MPVSSLPVSEPTVPEAAPSQTADIRNAPGRSLTGTVDEVSSEDLADDIMSALKSDVPDSKPPLPQTKVPPADVELPPRGGSVWPEPAGAQPRHRTARDPAPDEDTQPDAVADQKR